jgi:hypothetical protein
MTHNPRDAKPTVHVNSKVKGYLIVSYVLGAMLIAFSYNNAHHSVSYLHFDIFWLGMALVAIPTTYWGGWRCISSRAAVLLLISYGIFTFIPKFLMSISGPIFFDEYGHFRHANALLANGNIFNSNPYLPIVRYFPGLSLVTVGVHEVTRLSIWHSGQIVILLAHCSVLLTIFSISKSIGLSQRASFIAAMAYSFNPSYMYFDTQYAYESLALPLAFFVVLACIRARKSQTSRSSIFWMTTGAIAASLCIVTHHLSSLFMSLLCLVVVVCVRPTVPNYRSRFTPRLASNLLTGLAIFGTTSWLAGVAPSTFSYVWPHITSGFTEFTAIFGRVKNAPGTVGGTARAHAPFSGNAVPIYERLAGYLTPFVVLSFFGVAMLVLLNEKRGNRRLPSTVWKILRNPRKSWQSLDSNQRLVIMFVSLMGLYLISVPIALTNGGGEGAHRSWAYSYMGVSVVVGYVSERLLSKRIPTHGNRKQLRLIKILYASILSIGLGIVCVGNIAAGEDVLYRFPGPYIFGTATRSRTSELIRLAKWAQQHLPPNAGIVTDTFTGEIIEAYTDLRLPSFAQYGVYNIYVDGPHPSSSLRVVLRSGGFRYFILDKRIEYLVPQASLFPGDRGFTSISPVHLRDLNRSAFARVIYKSRNYEIFKLFLSK